MRGCEGEGGRSGNFLFVRGWVEGGKSGGICKW